MVKELMLLTERNVRNFSFCKTFITANKTRIKEIRKPVPFIYSQTSHRCIYKASFQSYLRF